jgi:copper chaperone CopZ
LALSFYNGSVLSRRLPLVLILACAPAAPELLRVELAVGGLDCLSCADSVGRALKRVKGVESAAFRAQDSVATVELKSGNTVPIEDLRDAVKGIGYTPKSAKIIARGVPRQEGGKWILKLAGSGAEYTLSLPAGVAPEPGAISVVEGAVAGPDAPLVVSSIHRE